MKNENGEYSETIIICFIQIFQETSLKIKIEMNVFKFKLSQTLSHTHSLPSSLLRSPYPYRAPREQEYIALVERQTDSQMHTDPRSSFLGLQKRENWEKIPIQHMVAERVFWL